MDLFRKKEIGESFEEGPSLVKCLTAFDLTLLGIGAIIGAGIFVLTGIVAATDAGPAVIFSYILAGLACIFSALSYAELASSLGGCGSAYGYAYAGFGEIVAWIVGWDLLFEYTISVSAVSVGWSSYANDFFLALKIHIPAAFLHGPENGGFFNLLACTIIIILMTLLTWGVKSSIRVNNIMVIIKLLVILMFIVIALGEVNPSNWTPFFPYGWEGVVKGASLIFFAYIGFDAVSTAAEEAINPQRDLPIGIIGSLFICTLLYMIVAGLLTGIAHYSTLNVASPISHALLVLGYKSIASFISVGAIAGLTTVMLVLFYGLTRIMLAMSRDGLLPKIFSQTNAYTHTPIRVIILSGIVMSLFAAFISMHDLTELVNIGTLFAFFMVCAGVLYLHYKRPELYRPFKTPGMPYVPILGMISCFYLMINLPFITLMRFVIWMVIGLVVYFSFAHKNSQLSKGKK
ncbi:amino acid permease [Legionella sainthelensi]|uniref:Amino acid permease n=1 Tax=Legionella sainthelensi TaxID=28087 RepID=A0A0W0YMT4_9GAMM|nr:amino acid permease [Legionella sainthelensi]KTD58181.1 amino acid permease [Legionella sainthelensi]VEH26728.1 amino acid permease [Legionella sainthelensi]